MNLSVIQGKLHTEDFEAAFAVFEQIRIPTQPLVTSDFMPQTTDLAMKLLRKLSQATRMNFWPAPVPYSGKFLLYWYFGQEADEESSST